MSKIADIDRVKGLVIESGPYFFPEELDKALSDLWDFAYENGYEDGHEEGRRVGALDELGIEHV